MRRAPRKENRQFVLPSNYRDQHGRGSKLFGFLEQMPVAGSYRLERPLDRETFAQPNLGTRPRYVWGIHCRKAKDDGSLGILRANHRAAAPAASADLRNRWNNTGLAAVSGVGVRCRATRRP